MIKLSAIEQLPHVHLVGKECEEEARCDVCNHAFHPFAAQGKGSHRGGIEVPNHPPHNIRGEEGKVARPSNIISTHRGQSRLRNLGGQTHEAVSETESVRAELVPLKGLGSCCDRDWARHHCPICVFHIISIAREAITTGRCGREGACCGGGQEVLEHKGPRCAPLDDAPWASYFPATHEEKHMGGGGGVMQQVAGARQSADEAGEPMHSLRGQLCHIIR
jgi:hypothetical protein